MAGCSSTLRSPAARSGPAKKKKKACRFGTEVAASSPSCWAAECLPVQPGTAPVHSPHRPLHLHSEFKDVRQNPSQFS